MEASQPAGNFSGGICQEQCTMKPVRRDTLVTRPPITGLSPYNVQFDFKGQLCLDALQISLLSGIYFRQVSRCMFLCCFSFEQEEKRNSDADGHQEVHGSRPNWMMDVLGLNVPRTMSTATQTVQRVRRTASTQTDRIDTEDYT